MADDIGGLPAQEPFAPVDFNTWSLSTEGARIEDPLQKIRAYDDRLRKDLYREGLYTEEAERQIVEAGADQALRANHIKDKSEYAPPIAATTPDEGFLATALIGEGNVDKASAIFKLQSFRARADTAPETLARAEQDAALDPAEVNRLTKAAVRTGKLPFAVVQNDQGKQILEVDPELGALSREEILDLADTVPGGVDPRVLPMLEKQFTREPGSNYTPAQARQESVFAKFIAEKGKTDEFLASEIDNAVTEYNRNGALSDETRGVLDRALTALDPDKEFSPESRNRFMEDMIKRAAKPEAYDPANPQQHVQYLNDGSVHLPDQVVFDEKTYTATLDKLTGITPEQKEAALAQREVRLTALAPMYVDAMGADPEALDFYTKAKAEGKNDSQIATEWFGDPTKYSKAANRIRSAGMGFVDATKGFVQSIQAMAFDDKEAMASLVTRQGDMARNEEYARLSGDSYGIGQAALNTAPQVVADILLTTAVSAAATPLAGGAILGARTAGASAVRALARGAVSAGAKSTIKTFVRGGAVRAATAMATLGDDLVKQMVKTVGPQRAVGAAVSQMASTAGTMSSLATTTFARAAGSSYVSTYSALDAQTLPNGTPKYTDEEKRKIALGTATISGISTAAITLGFGELLGPGVEGLVSGKLGTRALKSVFGMTDDTIKAASRSSALALLKSAGAEAPEEAVDQLLSGVYEKISTGEEFRLGPALKEALEAGAVGGLLGAGAGVVQAFATKPRDPAVAKLEAAGAPLTAAAVEAQTAPTKPAPDRGGLVEQPGLPPTPDTFSYGDEDQVDPEAQTQGAVRVTAEEITADLDEVSVELAGLKVEPENETEGQKARRQRKIQRLTADKTQLSVMAKRAKADGGVWINTTTTTAADAVAAAQQEVDALDLEIASLSAAPEKETKKAAATRTKALETATTARDVAAERVRAFSAPTPAPRRPTTTPTPETQPFPSALAQTGLLPTPGLPGTPDPFSYGDEQQLTPEPVFVDDRDAVVEPGGLVEQPGLPQTPDTFSYGDEKQVDQQAQPRPRERGGLVEQPGLPPSPDVLSYGDEGQPPVYGLATAPKEAFRTGQPVRVVAFRGENNTHSKDGRTFWSESKAEAAKYAASGTPVEKELRLNNPLSVANWMAAKSALGLPKSATLPEVLEAAENAGHDGVTWMAHSKREFIVLNTPAGGLVEQPGLPPSPDVLSYGDEQQPPVYGEAAQFGGPVTPTPTPAAQERAATEVDKLAAAGHVPTHNDFMARFKVNAAKASAMRKELTAAIRALYPLVTPPASATMKTAKVLGLGDLKDAKKKLTQVPIFDERTAPFTNDPHITALQLSAGRSVIVPPGVSINPSIFPSPDGKYVSASTADTGQVIDGPGQYNRASYVRAAYVPSKNKPKYMASVTTLPTATFGTLPQTVTYAGLEINPRNTTEADLIAHFFGSDEKVKNAVRVRSSGLPNDVVDSITDSVQFAFLREIREFFLSPSDVPATVDPSGFGKTAESYKEYLTARTPHFLAAKPENYWTDRGAPASPHYFIEGEIKNAQAAAARRPKEAVGDDQVSTLDIIDRAAARASEEDAADVIELFQEDWLKGAVEGTGILIGAEGVPTPDAAADIAARFIRAMGSNPQLRSAFNALVVKSGPHPLGDIKRVGYAAKIKAMDAADVFMLGASRVFVRPELMQNVDFRAMMAPAVNAFPDRPSNRVDRKLGPPTIEVETTILEVLETRLSAPEKAKIAGLLGHDSWTPEAASDTQAALADWVSARKSVSESIAAFFESVWQKLKQGSLSLMALVSFSPATLENSRVVTIDPATITAEVKQAPATPQVVAPLAPLAGPSAPAIQLPDWRAADVSEPAKVMASWVLGRNDAGGKPFIVADKLAGMVYMFDDSGTLVRSGPALYGSTIGDVKTPEQLAMPIEEIRKDSKAKITPAGRFPTGTTIDSSYGPVLAFAPGKFVENAVHKVFLGRPEENRVGRLKSEDPSDNRISLGCVNLSEEMAADAGRLFQDNGVLYVLPETEEGRALFEGFGSLPSRTPAPETSSAERGRMDSRAYLDQASIPTIREDNAAAAADLQLDGDLRSALERIVRSAKFPRRYRAVAKAALQMRALPSLHMVDDATAAYAGFYSGSSNSIHLNMASSNGRGLLDVLAHELLHAATAEIVRNPRTAKERALRDRLEKYRIAIAGNIPADMEYAVSSLDEFITHAATDPRFQRIARETIDAGRSVWDKIVEAIASFFGITNRGFVSDLWGFINHGAEYTNRAETLRTPVVLESQAVTPDVAPSRRALPDPAEVESRTVAGKTVGTRSPKAKGVKGTGVNQELRIDLASARLDPKLYKKNAFLLASYAIVAKEFPEIAARSAAATRALEDHDALIEGKRADVARLGAALTKSIKESRASRGKPLKGKAGQGAAMTILMEKEPGALASEWRAAKKKLKKLVADRPEVAKKATAKIDAVAAKLTMEEADALYEGLKTATRDNLKALIDLFPARLRDVAKLWYDGANIIAQGFSESYKLSLEQASAVIAVFSPQKDWFMNVAIAKRTMDIWTNHQNTPFSDAMAKNFLDRAGQPQFVYDKKGEQQFNDPETKLDPKYTGGAVPIFNETGTEVVGWRNWDAEKAAKSVEDARLELAAMRGKTLAQLEGRHQAVFIRMYEEVNNPGRGFPIISPDGNFGGNKQTEPDKNGQTRDQKLGWGSYVTIDKAIAIMTASKDSEMQVVSDALGEQHKVRSFYNNIVDPQSRDGHVTMDTHAIAALLWQALSGASRAVTQNFGGAGTASSGILGVNGLYPAFAEAYRALADDLKMLPRQVQSITWEAIRILFPAKWKSQKSNVAKVEKIWQDYRDGTITADDARSRIFELTGARATGGPGSLAEPDWTQIFFSGTNPAGPQEANDQGVLPADRESVMGSGRGSVGSGVDRDAAGLPDGTAGRGGVDTRFAQSPTTGASGDAEYLAAVESGNKDRQRELVDEAVRAAGKRESRPFNIEDKTLGGARYRGTEGYGVWLLPDGNTIPVDNHAATAKSFFGSKSTDQAIEDAFGHGWVIVRAIRGGDFRWDNPTVMMEGVSTNSTQSRNIKDWAIFHGFDVKSEVGKTGARGFKTDLVKKDQAGNTIPLSQRFGSQVRGALDTPTQDGVSDTLDRYLPQPPAGVSYEFEGTRGKYLAYVSRSAPNTITINRAGLNALIEGLDPANARAIVRKIVNHEIAHHAAFSAFTSAEIAEMASRLSPSELVDIASKYYGLDPVAAFERMEADMESGTLNEEALVDEYLRMHLERVTDGATTEDTIAFHSNNPGFVARFVRYLKDALAKLWAIVGGPNEDYATRVEISRLMRELRAIQNGHRAPQPVPLPKDNLGRDNVRFAQAPPREPRPEDAIFDKLQPSTLGTENPYSPASLMSKLFRNKMGDRRLHQYLEQRGQNITAVEDLAKTRGKALEKAIASEKPPQDVVDQALGERGPTTTAAQDKAIKDVYDAAIKAARRATASPETKKALAASRDAAIADAGTDAEAVKMAKKMYERLLVMADAEAQKSAVQEAARMKDAMRRAAIIETAREAKERISYAQAQLDKDYPKTGEAVRKGRQFIDRMSEGVSSILPDSGHIKFVVDTRNGVYLTMAYNLHHSDGNPLDIMEDPDKADIVAAAKEQLMRTLIEGRAEELIDEQAEAGLILGETEAREAARTELVDQGIDQTIVEDYLLEHGAKAAYYSGSKFSADWSRFMKQHEVPEALRALLGEITDPVQNLMRSAMNVGTLAASMRLAEDFATGGHEIGALVTRQQKDVFRKMIQTKDEQEFLSVALDVEFARVSPKKGYLPWENELDGAPVYLPVWLIKARQERNIQYLDNFRPIAGKEGKYGVGRLSEFLAHPDVAGTIEEIFATRGGATTDSTKLVEKLGNTLAGMTGVSLGVATLGSIGFFSRQIFAVPVALASNGINPVSKDVYRAIGLAMDIVTGKESYWKTRLNALGMSLDDLRPSVLKELVKTEIDKPGGFNILEMAGKLVDKIAMGATDGKGVLAGTKLTEYFAKLGEVVSAIDSVAKIAAFFTELRVLQEAYPDKSKEWHETEAAETVKRTMQARSQSMPVFDALGKSSYGRLMSPFLRFKGEVFRLVHGIPEQAMKEIRSGIPALVKRGRARMAGFSTAMAFSIAGPAVLSALFGVGDDEEYALRQSLPPYLRGSSLIYRKSEDGRTVTSINTTYLNYLAMIGDPISRVSRAVLRGDASEAADEAAIWFTSQFLEDQIFAGAAFEVLRNETSDGRKITFETDDFADAVVKKTQHMLGSAFTPQVLKVADRAIRTANNGVPADAAFLETPVGIVLGHMAPVKPVSIDLNEAAVKAGRTFFETNRDIRSVPSQLKRRRGMGEDEIKDVIDEWHGSFSALNTDMARAARGFESMGLAKPKVSAALTEAGFSKERSRELVFAGLVRAPAISPTLRQDIIAAGDAAQGKGAGVKRLQEAQKALRAKAPVIDVSD